MLKTVSSVANALGALNYKGTWNADTNTPTLASGVGTQGDYYVVSVAGATDLDGITNWGVGDWAAFNGSVWQRVEGGADGNFVNLDVTGAANLASLNVSKETGTATPDPTQITIATESSGSGWSTTDPWGRLAFYNSDGSGGGPKIHATIDTIAKSSSGAYSRVSFKTSDASSDTLTEVLRFEPFEKNVVVSNGNLVIETSGQGIDFSATAGTGTSELFDDYEEGTYTIEAYDATVGGNQSATTATGYYTKVGRQVFVSGALSNIDTTGLTSGNNVYLSLPFASSSSLSAFHPSSVAVNTIGFNTGSAPFLRMSPGTVFAVLAANKDGAAPVSITWGNLNTGAATSDIIISISYFV